MKNIIHPYWKKEKDWNKQKSEQHELNPQINLKPTYQCHLEEQLFQQWDFDGL